MINQTLVDYIKSVKAQGYENAAIIEALHNNGWQDKDINEAFGFISLSAQTPTVPTASPMKSEPNPEPWKAVPEEAVKNPEIEKVREEPIINYNSPFSIGLAIVLFVSLYILVNKVIHDVGIQYSNDINSILLLDAIITIPFLFVSFLLYGMVSQDRKKLIIVCKPYFIVSAFLFLRLLWHTGAYILDKNATYGVYIVLIMAILVLTGFVVFLQRFLKS